MNNRVATSTLFENLEKHGKVEVFNTKLKKVSD